MARRKLKKKQEPNWAIAAVVAIVLFASLFLIRADAPEHVVASSDDGVVTIDGSTRASGAVMIERSANVGIAFEDSLSDVYLVSLEHGGQLVGGELVFALPELDVTEVAIYQYDPSVLDWVPLPTTFDLVLGTVSSELTFLDSVMLIVGDRVDTE